jgi:hypothetical protein
MEWWIGRPDRMGLLLRRPWLYSDRLELELLGLGQLGQLGLLGLPGPLELRLLGRMDFGHSGHWQRRRSHRWGSLRQRGSGSVQGRRAVRMQALLHRAERACQRRAGRMQALLHRAERTVQRRADRTHWLVGRGQMADQRHFLLGSAGLPVRNLL